MSVSVECTGCAKRFRVKDEFVGQRVRCPGCKQGVEAIPSTRPRASASAAQPSRVRPLDILKALKPDLPKLSRRAWVGVGLAVVVVSSLGLLAARSIGSSSVDEVAEVAPDEGLDPEAKFSLGLTPPHAEDRLKNPLSNRDRCTHETFDRLMSRLRTESTQAARDATGRDDVEVVAETLSPYNPIKLFEELLGINACHAYAAVMESPSSGERWTVLKDEQGAPVCGLPEALFWWNVYHDQAEQSDYVSGEQYRPALTSLAACYAPGKPAEKKNDVEVLGINFAGLGNFEATVWRQTEGKRYRLVVEKYRTTECSPLDKDRREDLGKEMAEQNRKKLISQFAENDWHIPGGEVEVVDAEGTRDDLRATVQSRSTGKRFRVEVKHGRHVWTSPLDEKP